MGIEKFLKDREARLKSPAFEAAMKKEKAEFNTQLHEAKNESVNFLYNGLIKKALMGTVSAEAKSLFNSKHNLDKKQKKQKKGSKSGLLGATQRTAEAGLMGLKAVGKIAQAAGKGLKIGARYLVAK